MVERTLCVGSHLDRTGANPGLAGWLSGLLSLESQVYSASQRVWIKFRSFAFQRSDFRVDASEFFGLGFLPFRDFIGRHQRREM